jgi:type II secretory pathway pseudopilin PulG
MMRLFAIMAAVIGLTGCGDRLSEGAMAARETAAIQALRTISTAQIQYRSQYGKYAGTLRDLGRVAGGGQTGPGAADLIPGELAAGARNGYRFAVELTPGGFAATATAETFGVTGRRSFYTDETMVIRARAGSGASATDAEIQ